MPVKKQKNIPKDLVFFYLACFRMGKKKRHRLSQASAFEYLNTN